MTIKTEIIPPNFDLQNKLGAPVKNLPAAKILEAEQAVAREADAFEDFLKQVLARWKAAPAMPLEAIYRDAHDLRGLAGSFDRICLGRSADALCRYLDAVKAANAAPEDGVIKSIKDAVTTCAAFEMTERQACAKLSDSAREAVQIKLAALAKAPS